MSPLWLLLVPVLLLFQLLLGRLVLHLRAKAYGKYVKSGLVDLDPRYRLSQTQWYRLSGRQVFLLLTNVAMMALLALVYAPDETFVTILVGILTGMTILPICHNLSYCLQFWYVQNHPEAIQGEIVLSTNMTAKTLVWDIVKYLPLLLLLVLAQPNLFIHSFAAGWLVLLLVRLFTARQLQRQYAAKPIEDHFIGGR